MTILNVENVTKKFGNFTALDNFSFSIPRSGEITGLLGPNGAGKTTFIHTFLGIHKFLSGSIKLQLDGSDIELPKDLLQIKDLIGYMPEKDTRMHRTTAMRYVTHFGRLAGLPHEASKARAFDVLHYVGLEEARYRNMEEFSSGMLQRVKLATALVQDPKLLILDEPTAGMDPPGREKMLELIEDLGHTHGKYIIMCTHLLPDIERTSDYVVLISQGKMIMQGDLQTILKTKGESLSLRIETNKSNMDFEKILSKADFNVQLVDNDLTCIIDPKVEQNYLDIFKLAKENNFVITKLTSKKLSLEEVFIDNIKGEVN